MTSKNNRATLLYYIKLLCIISNPLVNSNCSYSPEMLNLGKNWRFSVLSAVWPWNLVDDLDKTIGHLFYATSSFVNYFKAIGEFKLEWQSGNSSIPLKISDICPLSPWKFMDDLKNNRAPLLCYFKISASFHSHLWIRTGVPVRKIPIWGQNWYFLALWPWNLTDNLDKQ